MAKTNFSKVEEALSEGLGKIQKQKLLEEADRAQGKSSKKTVEEKRKIVEKMRAELKKLHRKDKEVYEKIGLDKEIIKKLIKQPKNLAKMDFEALHEIELTISLYQQKTAKGKSKKSDEEIIENESEKHVNKRFNVNDDWLPLH